MIEGSGKRLLRRPKLSTRKFSAWKKKKTFVLSGFVFTSYLASYDSNILKYT